VYHLLSKKLSLETADQFDKYHSERLIVVAVAVTALVSARFSRYPLYSFSRKFVVNWPPNAAKPT
jgi:hypothetical protein